MAPSVAHRGGPQFGGGKGKVRAGKSVAIPVAKRRRKIVRDSVRGITRPDIRRLARRGGVKRISADIYDDVRAALKGRLETILNFCVTYVEHRNAKTITILDVLHSLQRLGRPIYGFDPETYDYNKKKQVVHQTATAL